MYKQRSDVFWRKPSPKIANESKKTLFTGSRIVHISPGLVGVIPHLNWKCALAMGPKVMKNVLAYIERCYERVIVRGWREISDVAKVAPNIISRSRMCRTRFGPVIPCHCKPPMCQIRTENLLVSMRVRVKQKSPYINIVRVDIVSNLLPPTNRVSDVASFGKLV